MVKKVVFIFILILSCTKEQNNNKTFKAAFNNVDVQDSGIDFSNDLSPSGELNIIEFLYY